ncbi:hypothetical protein OG747_41330 [Streptomyces sp. NBC_01384]|nr:hypothetical protein [Streptomyces mirabilis]QUW78461.1 hypothetical protein SMIR_04365 [Streptomyces mirabilis]
MTATGAVVIGLILVPMAWLVLRGERATGPAAPGEESPPSQIAPSPPR